MHAYSDPLALEIFELREHELLAKYRHKMKYFATSGFTSFLTKDLAHFERTCQKLEIKTEDLLPDYENGNLFIELNDLLDKIKTILYLTENKPNDSDFDTTVIDTDKLAKSHDPRSGRRSRFTTARQVLLLHYLFQVIGVNVRKEINVSDMAKFFHAMLGWEYTDINNSQLYKFLKKAPKIKDDKRTRYEDLHWVKEQFETLKLQDVVDMIEKELKEIGKTMR